MASPFPMVDFSQLASIPDSYYAGRKMARDQRISDARESAVKAGIPRGGDGAIDFSALAQRAGEAGDYQGAIDFAKLANAQELQKAERARNERDFRFRETEAARAQGNTDRSFGLQQRQFDVATEGQKVPPGFERAPIGGVRPVPGGPADPAYIGKVTGARDKGKELDFGDITKLSEEGGKFSNVTSLAQTFQPDYAGWGSSAVGNAANFAARNMGFGNQDAAAWWQSYDRHKNVVRNALFGSALTATEQAAFERSDINPGMTPDAIKRNLDIQQGILRQAMQRRASALVASGYNPAAVSRAYGADLSNIGVQGGRTRDPQSRTSLPAGVTADQAIAEARAAIAAGKPREAVAARLRGWGIDPSGL